nr:uncharacterized protein LOC129274131 [Lytechinus pictus]
MSKIDWDDLLVDLDCKDSWNVFSDTIHRHIEECIPKSRMTNKRKRKVYTTKRSNALSKRKNRAWKRYKSTLSHEDFRYYREISNSLRKLTRTLRITFEKDLAKNAKSNPKDFWRYVNSKVKLNKGIGSLVLDNGEKLYKSEDIVSALNEAFSKVFTKEDDSNVMTPEWSHEGSTLGSINFTQEKVEKQLISLNPNKSAGPDGIHPRVLKELAREISYPLTSIFNLSMGEGYLPLDWKKANIVPIHKKGSRQKATNYRPISLTSMVCKVMESLVKEEIMDHVKDNSLLHNAQHGFTPGRSCCTQLMVQMEKWTDLLDHGRPIDILYLDVRKAFDTVPHQRLLMKLKAYGIDGHVLKWIEAFLVGRIQRVALRGEYSDWSQV